MPGYHLQICQIWLDQIPFVTTRYSHILCGHYVNKLPSGAYECNFCCRSCDSEVVRTFHLKVTLADESAKISAWCTGHTATELLQISPDEFDELPEVLAPSPSILYLSLVVYAKTMFDDCAS